MNPRQVAEWAAEERLTPFDADRADLRQAHGIWWMRQTLCEPHSAKVTDYLLKFSGEDEKNEATILMDEVAELFSLR